MSISSNDMTLAVRQWRGRVAWVLFARHALMLLGAYCVLWGVVVLALRSAWQVDRLPLAWGATGMVILLAVAWWQAWRQVPPAQAVEAMLDSHSQAGGLYMARAQQAGWDQRMPAIAQPRVQWRGRRQWLIALAGVLFVVMAFVTPRWVTQVVAPRSLDVREDVAKLTEQLHVLEKEEILPSQQAQEMTQRLEQVRRDADGRDPVKTWEALDHIKERVNSAAEQAAEQALAQAQQMTQAQMLAEALKDHGESFTPEQLAKAMQSLEQMTQAAAAENQAFNEAFQQMQMNAGQALSPEQLEKLAQAMQLSKEQLQQMLSQLQQSGMADQATLEQVQRMCQMCKPGDGKDGSGKAAAKALAENMDGMPVEDILLQLMQGGSGGIGRGGGPTPMTWNQTPSSSENTAFKDQVLPPAELQAIRDSQRVGMSVAAPKAAEQPEQSTGGVLDAQNAHGSSVNQTVLPRHRAAVQKYFERNE